MAKISKRFDKGIVLRPTTTTTSVSGELSVNSSDNELKAYLNGAERSVVTKDQSQTLTNKTIDVDNNTVSNIEVDNLKSGVLNTSTSLTGASNTQVPSALATKTYVDNAVAGKDAANEISYSNATSGLAATNVQTAIDEVEASKDALVTLSGVALNATNLGTFTGSTIADNQTNKQALQALETSVETKADSSVVTEIDQNVNDLISLSGIAENVTTLGTFTGTTIPDSSTIKAALQSLETSVETKETTTVVAEIDQNVNDLITLSGVAENATNLGTFTGTTIADNTTVKAALQSLETSVETKATGAASSTDNAIVRFDSTTGKVIQNSVVTIDDTGIATGFTQLNVDNLRLDGNTLSTTDTNGSLEVSPNGVGGINLNNDTRFLKKLSTQITSDSATGANATLTAPTTKMIRLTNASLTSIDMIPAGGIGEHLTIINSTGNSIVINDNTGATAANRILTGQKSNITLKDEASLHLEYDNSESRWMVIGGVGSSASSSGINYLSTNPDFEVNATGYSAYADAAGTSPVDGTGGSPSTTIVRSTSTPLRGTASGLWSKSAANRQGEGFSYAFTIDTADQAKVLEISYDYTTSANFVDADMRMFIYDVTNAVIIEPSQRDIQANAGQGKYLGYFQAASNSLSYRVIWHVASTSALAYDFKLDNVKVGPPSVATNTKAAACKIYLGTSNQTVSASTETTVTLNATKFDTAGMATLASNGITIPESGLYYLNTNINYLNLTADERLTVRIKNGSTVLAYMDKTDTLSTTSATIGSATLAQLNKGDVITVTVDSQADTSYNIAFSGTEASFSYLEAALIKSDAASISNSAIAFKVYLNTAANHTSSGSFQIVPLDTVQYDTAGGFNAANNRWEAPESGYYFLSSTVTFTSIADTNAVLPTIFVNGTTTAMQGTVYRMGGTGVCRSNVNGIHFLNKGDYVQARIRQDDSASEAYTTGSDATYFSGFKIAQASGVVAPTEVVYAKYNTNAGQSITNSSGTFNVVDFEDKITDTHSAVTTGSSWKFTAPITGYYQVNCSLEFASSAWTTGDGLRISVSKDLGVNIFANMMTSWPSTFTGSLGMWGSTAVEMLKGETITIGILAVRTGGSTNLRTIASRNEVSIFKI